MTPGSTRRRSTGLLVLALVALAAPRAARADEAAAARSFQEGSAAYARRDYPTAARAFEAAFRAEPRGAALYNAGLAWEAAGTLGQAADDYAEALRTGGLDALQNRDAKKRLATLTKKLGFLSVEAPPGAQISFDGGEFQLARHRRHATAGEHEIVVNFADGQTATKRVTVEIGATASADFPAPAPLQAPPPPPPPPPSRPPIRTAGWVAMGLSAGAMGAAIGTGFAAISARDTFDRSNYTDRKAHDRAASLRTGANVAWGIAGALGAAGVVLVVVGSSGPSPSAALRLGPTSLEVIGRF